MDIKSDKQIILNGIDLTDSFILNWELGEENFLLDMEFSIWPESPYYIEPKDDEYTCYKIGKLIFIRVKLISGFVDLYKIRSNKDLDGSEDLGNIYGFRKEDNKIKFETDFTEFEIECDGFEIIINE